MWWEKAVILCLVIHYVTADDLVRPPLGWSSDYLGCRVAAEDVIEAANSLVHLNLTKNRFTYVVLGDCWQAPARTRSGFLQADPARFPGGIAPLVAHVHSLGLQFGITTAAGDRTCAGQPGSWQHHTNDAVLFASWAVDLVQLQACSVTATEFREQAQNLKKAMTTAGADVHLSLDHHHTAKSWQWPNRPHAVWRTSSNKLTSWESVVRAVDQSRGLASYVRTNSIMNLGPLFLQEATMTDTEVASTIALVASMRSALFVSGKLSELPRTTLDILRHNELFGLAAERNGIPVSLAFQEGDDVVYASSLQNGDRIVLLWNRRELTTAQSPTELELRWSMLNVKAGKKLVVRDILGGRQLGVHHGAFTAAVAPRAVTLLRLSPARGQLASWSAWSIPECDADDEPENVDSSSPLVMVFNAIIALMTVATLVVTAVAVRTVIQHRRKLRTQLAAADNTSHTYTPLATVDLHVDLDK